EGGKSGIKRTKTKVPSRRGQKRTNLSLCRRSGPAPGTVIPCLLVHHRRHLGFVGELLGENFLPISSPVLLSAKIDAPADERIVVDIYRLPVHDFRDEFVRWQTLHRGKPLRRIRNSDLKTGGGEQVLLL